MVRFVSCKAADALVYLKLNFTYKVKYGKIFFYIVDNPVEINKKPTAVVLPVISQNDRDTDEDDNDDDDDMTSVSSADDDELLSYYGADENNNDDDDEADDDDNNVNNNNNNIEQIINVLMQTRDMIDQLINNLTQQ